MGIIKALKLIRFPNLVMVFISQLVVYKIIHDVSPFKQAGSTLTIPEFLLLGLCTILIAASGYIINDIYDQEIDAINKPERQIVGVYLSSLQAKVLYSILLIIGLAISFYLGFTKEKSNLIVLFPISAGLLFLYASHLKKSFLLGNVIVSLFVAAVPLIVILGFYDSFKELFHQHQSLAMALFIYAQFAFLANMLREVVKDIEDMHGDSLAEAKTLPIVLGKINAVRFCALICIIFIACISYLLLVQQVFLNMPLQICFVLIIIFTFYLIFHLRKAESKHDFKKISTHIKFLMLFGLCSLIIWPL